MQHQSDISARRLERRIGGIEPVLIDSVEGNVAIARSYGDAPEIDGQVIVSGARAPRPGDAVMVRVTRADQYDLHAEAVDESELSRSAVI
jgi:ribosomal protein S12 methylthiotransferase